MMWQKIILQSAKKAPDSGFLTLEIIIATLIAFFFLMFSLQALTLSMFMKVKAQEDQRADQLIQEDIERIGNLSSSLTLDLATNCDVDDYDSSYADALLDALEIEAGNGSSALDVYLLGGQAGKKLTLSRTNLSYMGSTPPYRSLKVYYQVRNDDNELIATRYLETIPDEALRCP